MSGVRNRVVNNAVANYVGAAALIASPIITLPMYLRVLGDEQWGLIGFVSTLQSLAAVLDAGMGQVLVREFAVRMGAANEGRSQVAGRLLGSCERFYWLAGAAIAVLLVAFSSPIANRWLTISDQHQDVGQLAVMGAGVLCALQLPALLYRGLLVAAQDHVKLNSVLVAGSILRFGGGVVAVSIYSSVVAYLVWHSCSLALEVYARSHFAWKAVGGREHLSVSTAAKEMRSVIAGMSVWTAAATIGIVTSQMDKSILAAMRPIAEITPYFIASQLASGSMQLFHPVITAVLPALMHLDRGRESRLNAQLALVITIAALCVLLGAFMFLFGDTVLALWLGEQRAGQVMPLLRILLIGVACNAFCNVGYINWLAHNRRVRLLAANITALLAVAVATPLLVTRMDTSGAACAWLAGQLVVLLVSLDWVRDALKYR